MDDHGLHNFRYVRGLVGGAALHSVTFDGIEDFMTSPDARDAGLAVLLWEDGSQMTSHVIGSDSLSDVLSKCRAMGTRVREVARPIAVVTFPRTRFMPGAAEMLASGLRLRIALNAVDPEMSSQARRLVQGNDEALPDEIRPLFQVIVAETPLVLGDDPFAPPATRH